MLDALAISAQLSLLHVIFLSNGDYFVLSAVHHRLGPRGADQTHTRSEEKPRFLTMPFHPHALHFTTLLQGLFCIQEATLAMAHDDHDVIRPWRCEELHGFTHKEQERGILVARS